MASQLSSYVYSWAPCILPQGYFPHNVQSHPLKDKDHFIFSKFILLKVKTKVPTMRLDLSCPSLHDLISSLSASTPLACSSLCCPQTCQNGPFFEPLCLTFFRPGVLLPKILRKGLLHLINKVLSDHPV
jgi:hypothetical protein